MILILPDGKQINKEVNREMKFRSLFIIMLLLSMIFVSACSNSKGTQNEGANKKETIEFWTMQLKPTFTDYIQNMINDFESKNPNIKVNWVDVPASDLQQKMLSAVSSKTAPDLVNLPVGFATKLVSMDALVHINEALTKEQQDQYFAGGLKAYTTYDSKVTYGIPWYLSIEETLYNAEIFKKAGLDPNNPPKTFEEAAEVAKVIKEKTGKYGFYPSLDLSLPLRYMVMFGAPLLNEDGTKAAFNTPEGLHMFQYFTDLYKNDLIPHSIITDDERKGIDEYAAGNIAIFSTGPQYLTQIKENAPDVYKDTLTSEGITGKSGLHNMSVQGLVIPKQSKHQKAAIKLALFITNPKNEVEFSKLTTIYPSNKKAIEDPYFTQLPKNPEPTDRARITGAKELENSEVLVDFKGNTAVANELQQALFDALQKSMLGKLSPKEAVQEAESNWTDRKSVV